MAGVILRLASRRAEQSTDEFRKTYSIRAGIESLNSQLKRKMGMGRLRIRGSPMVSFAVLLRCAGWNLLCALRAKKKRGIRDFSTYLPQNLEHPLQKIIGAELSVRQRWNISILQAFFMVDGQPGRQAKDGLRERSTV
jgi:hypothetical protein